MPRGGPRRGAGRPKGTKDPQTLSKEADREALRLHLREMMRPVAEALVSRARGVRYFVTRNRKTGKYELVTNAEQVIAALNHEDENTGEFYTDKPDTAAIKEFFDRSIDRSKDQPHDVQVTGTLDIVSVLRQRYARARSQAD